VQLTIVMMAVAFVRAQIYRELGVMDMLSVRKFLTVVSVSLFLFTLSAQAATPFNGVTKGSFAVSPSGAATYTIPIEVPPGIAGLQPELALSYNSQGGNGLLGMGWSLSGLSAITRCPKTLDQDGVKVGVKLDSTDRYCFNGQRLIVVNGLPYGSDGAEYRTEIDSLTKITSHGPVTDGPDHFIVETKAGRIIEFGNTTDSNINVTNQSNGQLRTLLWAANKISDVAGNELTISYIEEVNIGHYRVSRIDYGNGNQSVRFEYPKDSNASLVRPDLISGYIAGTRYTTPTLLTNVRTYINEDVVRDYRLDYGPVSATTGRSKLKEITECDGVDFSSHCKLLNTFLWKEVGDSGLNSGSLEISAFGYTAGGWRVENHPRMMSDVNGDGMTDVVGFANAGVYVSRQTALSLPLISGKTG